jgi:chromosome partitioning protein
VLPDVLVEVVVARTIAVANQKGGVGKTTTAVNLGAGLAMAGHRVLVVDIDPQASATTGLGHPPSGPASTVYELLLGERSARELIRRTKIDGLDLIPSTRDLVGAEIELVTMPNREQRLWTALRELRDDYAFILIDCPPSLSLLTLNALRAADGLLVPLQAEYYALEGLTALLDTVARVREALNPSLVIDGLVLTMFDGRTSLARQVQDEVLSHFGAQVVQTVIPRNVRLSESPSHGLPVLLYDPTSRGAMAYRALAQELLGLPVATDEAGDAIAS